MLNLLIYIGEFLGLRIAQKLSLTCVQ